MEHERVPMYTSDPRIVDTCPICGLKPCPDDENDETLVQTIKRMSPERRAEICALLEETLRMVEAEIEPLEPNYVIGPNEFTVIGASGDIKIICCYADGCVGLTPEGKPGCIRGTDFHQGRSIGDILEGK